MDPDEAFKLWQNAVDAEDFTSAEEHADDLSEWIERGGYEPNWTESGRNDFHSFMWNYLQDMG